MADIVLTHSAKGSTWQKKGAAYISRVKKNGKWVYTYATNKAGQASKAIVSEANEVADNAKNVVSKGKKKISSMLRLMRANKIYQKKKANRSRLLKDAYEGAKKNEYYRYNTDVVKAYNKGERGKTYEEYVKDNKKKYKKQAKAQKRSKNKIAREHAVGAAKKYVPDIKNLRSGVIRGGGPDRRKVSKNAIKKNAGKKR